MTTSTRPFTARAGLSTLCATALMTTIAAPAFAAPSSSTASPRTPSATSATVKAAQTPPNRSASSFIAVQPGSPWQDVRAVQYLLATQGQKTNGSTSYDAATKSAVSAYQRAAKLPVTGIADAKTLESLTSRASLAPGTSSAAMLGVETLLTKHGYAFGTGSAPAMTTSYTPAVKTLVTAFQAGHAITASGTIGPMTWRTLFAAKTSGPIYPLMQGDGSSAQWTNCGPASAVMIALYLGKQPPGWTGSAATRSAAINTFRYSLAGVPKSSSNDQHVGTTPANLVPAFAKLGIRARGTNIDAVIAAAKQGKPSISGGDAYQLPWNRATPSHVRGPASHFIAVLGWDGNRFLVVDPIAMPAQNVVHLLTEQQLRTFAATAPGWGPHVPGNDVPPSRNNVVTG